MAADETLWSRQSPAIIGIAGGSGAGKTWLAHTLLRRFTKEASLISLDDFYRDRSHLPAKTRARINFDHPRAIDWSILESVLQECTQGKKTLVPTYDFATHSRTNEWKPLVPKQFVVVEGLWLFRRPTLRRMFDLRIFVDCAAELRLERRLARDCRERARTDASVREQFSKFVEPMHEQFVSSQKRWADLVFSGAPAAAEIEQLVQKIESNTLARSL